MEVLVGKYVKTHGIKGEIKIRSNIKYKEKVFKQGNTLKINNQEFVIRGWRKHQEYDMITFKGINDINQIIDLKGSNVYIDKDLLNLDTNEYLDTDLIGLDIYIGNKLVGKVDDITYLNHNKKLLVINNKYIPFELIKDIDLKNKKIIVEEVLGLI